MTLQPGAADNTDCDLIAALWGLLSKPDSGEWYLGSIIRNGLKVPSLGVDIPAFPSVSIGDIPEQTMFDWATEHLGVSMSGTVLSGLDSFSGGTMQCRPVSATETDVTMTLDFASVLYSGSYDVGASGVTGCALATASTLLGNPPSLPSAAGDAHLDLATWYRDNPSALPSSDNGQVLVGQYYLSQDALQEVTTSDSIAAQAYRSVLSQQHGVAELVTSSTRFWQQEVDGQQPPGAPPTIGAFSQYAGGFKTYTYLNKAVQQARTDAGEPLEPGNDYAELQNAMAHFNAQVLKVQKDHPGEHDTQTIMQYVTDASPAQPEELLELGVAGIPVHAEDSVDVIDHVALWPIDRQRALQAYAARAPRRAVADDWFNVKGTFADAAQQLGVTVTCAFTATGDSKLSAKATALSLTIGNLHITLGNKSGFDSQPGLYDKVTSWIANTPSFQDTLISKLNSGLNDPTVLAHLSDALNGGLKKLGFQ